MSRTPEQRAAGNAAELDKTLRRALDLEVRIEALTDTLNLTPQPKENRTDKDTRP